MDESQQEILEDILSAVDELRSKVDACLARGRRREVYEAARMAVNELLHDAGWEMLPFDALIDEDDSVDWCHVDLLAASTASPDALQYFIRKSLDCALSAARGDAPMPGYSKASNATVARLGSSRAGDVDEDGDVLFLYRRTATPPEPPQPESPRSEPPQPEPGREAYERVADFLNERLRKSGCRVVPFGTPIQPHMRVDWAVRDALQAIEAGQLSLSTFVDRWLYSANSADNLDECGFSPSHAWYAHLITDALAGGPFGADERVLFAFAHLPAPEPQTLLDDGSEDPTET